MCIIIWFWSPISQSYTEHPGKSFFCVRTELCVKNKLCILNHFCRYINYTDKNGSKYTAYNEVGEFSFLFCNHPPISGFVFLGNKHPAGESSLGVTEITANCNHTLTDVT